LKIVNSKTGRSNNPRRPQLGDPTERAAGIFFYNWALLGGRVSALERLGFSDPAERAEDEKTRRAEEEKRRFYAQSNGEKIECVAEW